jgi:hypothetical protein
LLRIMQPKFIINGGNLATQQVLSVQFAPRFVMESKIIHVCGVADSSITVVMVRLFNVTLVHFVNTSYSLLKSNAIQLISQQMHLNL